MTVTVVRGLTYRVVLLVLGLAVASGGFVALTGFSETSRAAVKATVDANARGPYDLLVRPKESRPPMQRSEQLAQSGSLVAIRSGISMDQWRDIQAMSGVEIAAPLAIMGYWSAPAFMDVGQDIMPTVEQPGLLRVKKTYTYDGGRSREVYGTHFVAAGGDMADIAECVDDEREGLGNYAPRDVAKLQADCVTLDGPEARPSNRRMGAMYPLLAAAVDPEAEARMFGLDAAVVAGNYLPPGDVPDLTVERGVDQPVMPLLLSDEPPVDLTLDYEITRLPVDTIQKARDAGTFAIAENAPGEVVAQGTLTAQDLADLAGDALPAPAKPLVLSEDHEQWFSRSMNLLQRPRDPELSSTEEDPQTLRVKDFGDQRDQWIAKMGMARRGTSLPPAATDVALREPDARGRLDLLDYRKFPGGRPAPTAVRYGTFDASAMRDRFDLDGLAGGHSSIYAPMDLRDADGALLRPSTNANGYVPQSVSAIGSVHALQGFTEGLWHLMTFRTPNDRVPNFPVNDRAPLSVVRVRVAGVTGMDAASQDRISAVADHIMTQTGLDVDVVMGRSTAQRDVIVPAGMHGRPELRLTEKWDKLGVGLTIVNAVDWKSVVLFFLVLGVAFFFVVNVLGATVRARRTEIAVRLCLGWSRWRVFGWVVTGVWWQAVAAGLIGAVFALVVGSLSSAHIGWRSALLALPVAVGIGLPAGIVFGWRASRLAPLEAVQAPVRSPAKAGRELRGVTGLAWTSTIRDATRSAFAALGLAVAVCAALIVGVVMIVFRGAVVGSLLGDVVAVQVRTVDLITVCGIIVLAGVGVANVLFLNIRERGNELALLQATGWSRATLTRLILTEGAILGLVGAVGGVVVGMGVVTVLTKAVTLATVGMAGAGVMLGVGIALIAAIVPLRALDGLPTAALLTEEGA